MKRTLNGMNDFLTAEQARNRAEKFVPDKKLVRKYQLLFEEEIKKACDEGRTSCCYCFLWLTQRKLSALKYVFEGFRQLGYDIGLHEDAVYISWDE